ncbi:MAG: hypothetical protein ATN36_03740 [Epulopiscium sp. Nele67-Bin005]|nr:MAG: hypothetical protein ATN36_03740 [Epulopiscium sp. Nele67-Bin005]
MIWAIMSSLILGIAGGQLIFSNVVWFENTMDLALYVLLFSVGISVGTNKEIWEKIKQYNIRILIIPVGTIIGTLLGGIISSFLLKMPMYEALAVSSGLGWYTLSGVLLTDLGGSEIGTIAFLSNVLREIISFMIIPILAKYTNFYTVIAPAGATSEDTTLPIIIKYTNEEMAVISVINGVLCSSAVPILINSIYLFK